MPSKNATATNLVPSADEATLVQRFVGALVNVQGCAGVLVEMRRLASANATGNVRALPLEMPFAFIIVRLMGLLTSFDDLT